MEKLKVKESMEELKKGCGNPAVMYWDDLAEVKYFCGDLGCKGFFRITHEIVYCDDCKEKMKALSENHTNVKEVDKK